MGFVAVIRIFEFANKTTNVKYTTGLGIFILVNWFVLFGCWSIAMGGLSSCPASLLSAPPKNNSDKHHNNQLSFHDNYARTP